MQDGWSLTTRVVAALAIGAAAAVLVSGCSAPGAFPTVLDSPTARDDAPLSPDQVKQAVDNLISERKHLCSEAMASGGPGPNTSAGAASANCAPENAATTGSTQTAGAGAKP